MPTIIAQIKAREILDSRGNPTVEADVISQTASWAARPCRAAPAPASTKRSSCATATRRATAARACSTPVKNVEDEIAPGAAGP